MDNKSVIINSSERYNLQVLMVIQTILYQIVFYLILCISLTLWRWARDIIYARIELEIYKSSNFIFSNLIHMFMNQRVNSLWSRAVLYNSAWLNITGQKEAKQFIFMIQLILINYHHYTFHHPSPFTSSRTKLTKQNK